LKVVDTSRNEPRDFDKERMQPMPLEKSISYKKEEITKANPKTFQMLLWHKDWPKMR